MQHSISSLGFLDLSLVLALGHYDPKILTDKFLKAKGIIPNDWQLAKPVESNMRQIELLFKNGVRIIGQPGAIRFVESMVGKTIEALVIPAIARKFSETLPNLDYRSVGLNPRRYRSFSNSQDSARNFINEVLFTPNAWQTFGKEPMRPSIDLNFTLEQCLLRVNVQEAKIQLRDQKPTSAVFFIGNYHYSIQEEAVEARLASINQAMDNLSNNLESYQELIDNKFLSQNNVEQSAQPVEKTQAKRSV